MKNKNAKKKNKSKKAKKSLFIVLGCIILVCVLCLYFIFKFDFAFSKESEEKVLTKEELRELEVEKLRAALIKAEYVEYEENKFKKILIETFKEDGTYLNSNVLYFDIDSLEYMVLTYTDSLRVSTTQNYSFFTNIATGRTVFFEDYSNEWRDVWNSNYDFNSGIGTCSSAFGYSCSANDLVDFKNSIAGFVASNKIDIEILKEV